MHAIIGNARPEFHPRHAVDGIPKHFAHRHAGFLNVRNVKGIRLGELVVEGADSVDEQRVRLSQSQPIQGSVGTILRGHGHQRRLPSFFGFEMDGFGQPDFEIHVGVVWKFLRGIADERHAHLRHDFFTWRVVPDPSCLSNCRIWRANPSSARGLCLSYA